MNKLILTLVVGVFVTAFTMELLKRRRAKLLGRTRDRAKAAVADFREAFAEGYRSA